MGTIKGRPDVKEIVGANVRALLRAKDADFAAACKRLDMKSTQLKRIMAGRHAITMDTLQRLAEGYGVEPYQLLIPDLDPRNPQVLRALSQAELNLYRALEEARRDGGTQ